MKRHRRTPSAQSIPPTRPEHIAPAPPASVTRNVDDSDTDKNNINTTEANAEKKSRTLFYPVDVEFLQYLRVECGLAANTLLAYGRDLKKFDTFLRTQNSPNLTHITTDDIVNFIANMAQHHLKPVSRARTLIAIRMFFRYAISERYALHDPTAVVDQPRLWQHLPHDLSPTDVDKLLRAEKGKTALSIRNRAILEVFYATGARVSEVCEIRLRDVALQAGTLRLRGKGSKERMVPLSGTAAKVLTVYLNGIRTILNRSRGRDDNALFLSRTGRPLDRENVYRVVKNAARKAGIKKNVYPHLLRHSFATHLLAGGANLRLVQTLLGHADVATTEIYTHVHEKRKIDAYFSFHPRAG